MSRLGLVEISTNSGKNVLEKYGAIRCNFLIILVKIDFSQNYVDQKIYMVGGPSISEHGDFKVQYCKMTTNRYKFWYKSP